MSCSSSLLLASAAAISLNLACASSTLNSPFPSAPPPPNVSSAVLSAQGSGEVLSPVGEEEKAWN